MDSCFNLKVSASNKITSNQNEGQEKDKVKSNDNPNLEYANRIWNVTCPLRTATDKSGSSPSMTLTTVAKLQKRYSQESLIVFLDFNYYFYFFSCFIKHRVQLFHSLRHKCKLLFQAIKLQGMATFPHLCTVWSISPCRTCPAWCTASTTWWTPPSITRARTRARRCVSNWPSLQRTDPIEETLGQVRNQWRTLTAACWGCLPLGWNEGGAGWPQHYWCVHSGVCPPQSVSEVAVTRKTVAMRTNDSGLTSGQYSTTHTLILTGFQTVEQVLWCGGSGASVVVEHCWV